MTEKGVGPGFEPPAGHHEEVRAEMLQCNILRIFFSHIKIFFDFYKKI